MLGTEAPFPNVGASALLIETHKAIPVRILQNGEGKGRRKEVLVSLQDREGSSGNRRVRLADLVDATALTEAEEAELLRLERKLAGQSRPLKAKADRCERLRLRAVHAAQLADMERQARWNTNHRYPARGR